MCRTNLMLTRSLTTILFCCLAVLINASFAYSATSNIPEKNRFPCRDSIIQYFPQPVLDRLLSIHQHVVFHETMCAELPEQLMHVSYLKQGDKVLELGANTGRSTLVLAKQVGPQGAVYASEIHHKLRQQLQKTIHENRLEHYVKAYPAFSKKTLLYNDSDWKSLVWPEKKPIPKGWSVAEIANPPTASFNVVVADCEGCLLPLLEAYPKLLDNVDRIILENDAPTIQINHLHSLLRKKGFTSRKCLPLHEKLIAVKSGTHLSVGPRTWLNQILYEEQPHARACFYQYWQRVRDGTPTF